VQATCPSLSVPVCLNQLTLLTNNHSSSSFTLSLSPGGYMANMRVGSSVVRATNNHVRRTGNVTIIRSSQAASVVAPGSQQQWFSRDSTVSGMKGGVWNMVFSGVQGAPADHCSNTGGDPVTVVEETPTISEKPYITIGADGKFSIQVPPVKTESSGADFPAHGSGNSTASVGTAIPFDNVYVTKPGDTAVQINAKLAEGLSCVVTPAIYQLSEPLVLNHSGQVLLGLGLATLVSSNQNPVVKVGDVDAVRVAGLLLQAGPPGTAGSNASTLLEWGSTAGYAGNPKAPGLIQDVFARVGGPDGTATSPVAVNTMVHVRSGNVIGDNLWLWRADHAEGAPVTYTSNRCDHGLVVDGDDVSFYGLAVEHTLQDLTVWNGERGQTIFYQSELPYGVSQAQFGTPGYAGYRVAPHVMAHSAWGVAVYCFFRDYNVTVASGIVVPPALEHKFVAPLSVILNGNGGISHVINDKGGSSMNGSSTGIVNYVCEGVKETKTAKNVNVLIQK